ncbi:hypothetical protein [Streptomyces longisporus]
MQQHDPADRTSAHRIHPLIDNMRSILACDTVQTESAPEEGNRPNPAVVT